MGIGRARTGARVSISPTRPVSARDETGARACLCRVPETPRAVSRNLFAREHRRQARRGCARHRRPPRGNGEDRPVPPEAHNAGVTAEDRNSTAWFGGSGCFLVSLGLSVPSCRGLCIRVSVGCWAHQLAEFGIVLAHSTQIIFTIALANRRERG